jgi:hypothetical protein
MKGILINSEKQEISYVEIGSNSKVLGDLYIQIGNGCELVTVPIQYENSDVMYVDDEGIYNTSKTGFGFSNWRYPIVGNAVILGSNDEGDSEDCKSTLETFKNVIWLNENVITEYKDSF